MSGKSRNAIVAVVAVMVLTAACTSQQAAAPVRHHATAVVAPPSTTTTTTTAPAVPVSTTVATAHGDIPGSPAPGAPSTTTVPGSWYGYPSVLPVIAQTAGWLEVRLAQRPNESTAWVPTADVTLSTTPYRIVIDLTTEHLAVYQSGKEIDDFPAGIGTPDDPTVTGNFFMTMQVPPPDPSYGPFVLVTSAHSNSITDWDGSGDAIIAIHGPIDSYDDSLIGTTGAQISHGCVRLHDSDLAQLASIPAGTPIDIVN
jgi:lipoprotein-anchoring transpeptidase ErfK/SrfK